MFVLQIHSPELIMILNKNNNPGRSDIMCIFHHCFMAIIIWFASAYLFFWKHNFLTTRFSLLSININQGTINYTPMQNTLTIPAVLFFYKINDRKWFTHDRIRLMHNRAVYTHDAMGLMHDYHRKRWMMIMINV